MKRRRWTTILFGLVFLAGACILLYPTMLNLYNVWQSKQEIRNYTAEVVSAKEDYSRQWKVAEKYNERLAEKENQMMMTQRDREEYRSILDIRGTGMMGYIEIPKIDVHLPIYHGTEETVLQVGAGHWEGTSLPAGGVSTHCVLTAHTGLVKAKMFTDVDQLKEGDVFTITILDRVLTYEVDQTMVTQPEDQSELFVKKGEDLVTLYTCYPYGVNTHRLLVRGHRIPTPKKETPAVTLLQLATEEWYGKGILAAAVLLLVIILLTFGKKKKKKEKAEGKRQEKPDEATEVEQPQNADRKPKEPEGSDRRNSEKREGDG
ncbi:MAG: class C sortase [Lachnospiraceae bacterium]|jgi:sortase A|nr:class C sortase [Lachnospiraceae bacterium]